MALLTNVDLDDAAPFKPLSDDAEPLMCQFSGCENTVKKPARGKTPIYCPEHRGNTASTRTRTAGKAWPKSEQVKELLHTYVNGIAFGVGVFDQTDRLIIETKGPAVVDELVELAKTDKTLRKYLEWIATPGKYAPLTVAVGSLLLPIAINHGLLGFVIPKQNEGGEQ